MIRLTCGVKETIQMSQYNIIPHKEGDYSINPKLFYFVCDEFLIQDRVDGSSILKRQEDFKNVCDGKLLPYDVKGKVVKCRIASGYNLDIICNKNGELFVEIYDGETLVKSGFTGIILLDETYAIELYSDILYLFNGNFFSSEILSVEVGGKSVSEMLGYCYFCNVLYGYNPLTPKKYNIDLEVDMESVDYASMKLRNALKRKSLLVGSEELRPFLQVSEMLYEVEFNINHNLAILDSNYQVTYKYDENFSRFDDAYNTDEYNSTAFMSMNRGYKVLGENTILVSIQSVETEGCMIYLLYHEGKVFMSTNMFVWDKYVDKSNNVSLVHADLMEDYDGITLMEKVNYAMSARYLRDVGKNEFISILKYLPMVFYMHRVGIISVPTFDLVEGLKDVGVRLNCKVCYDAVKELRNIDFPLLKGQVKAS